MYFHFSVKITPSPPKIVKVLYMYYWLLLSLISAHYYCRSNGCLRTMKLLRELVCPGALFTTIT